MAVLVMFASCSTPSAAAQERQERQESSPVLGLGPAHVGQVFSLPPNPGAPFTATVEFETTQVLSDRTVIIHKSTSYVARDSKGRTRIELRVESPTGETETLQVILYDPQTRVRTTLSPKTNTAAQGKAAGLGNPPDQSQTGAAAASDARASRGSSQKSFAGEDIGVDYLDGVEVRHVRQRKTVTTGVSAEDGPVETTYEYWYSPELKVNLLSKRNDPRTGSQSARLKDIHRGEPSASLFEIPTGYKLIAADKK
jgi:hypothetical protein